MSTAPSEIRMIPLDRITIVNPRVRNQAVFGEIVENIAALGLKRPVTVTQRGSGESATYELVCGQGRLEAYRALGQKDIPAVVIKADTEQALVMSLVENCARRKHRAVDLLRDIEGLKRRGYQEAEIARKTDLAPAYVKGVVRLVEDGEHRLLRAVESGHIPISVAVKIADSDDETVQDALQQAYESKQLRGQKLLIAKKLVEQRRRRGKGFGLPKATGGRAVTPDALLHAYREDTEKKQLLVRKAEATRERLTLVTAALATLVDDENFVTLLRAEGLDTLPRQVADRMPAGRSAA
ncbi:MAG: chromosome partitioning protein ParB [Alphaproteobacteria bacterium]|nr:chromosome partitioning protein ParB [Alphaproteobacteria bacterium]